MAFTSALHEISTALCNCAVAAFASCPTVLQLASGEPMALPQELAVDRPVKLGATLNGNTTDGFLTFRYDFQPDSMQRVAQGDLLFFGKEQEKVFACSAVALCTLDGILVNECNCCGADQVHSRVA